MHEVYIYIFYLLLKNFNVFFLVSVSAHSHSSLSKNVPDHLKDFFPEFPENPGNKSDWKVKIIWKSVGQDPVLILSPFNNQVWFPNTVPCIQWQVRQFRTSMIFQLIMNSSLRLISGCPRRSKHSQILSKVLGRNILRCSLRKAFSRYQLTADFWPQGSSVNDVTHILTYLETPYLMPYSDTA